MPKEYIGREATIEKIKQVYCSGCNSHNEIMCRSCGIADALLQIDAEPAADVAPVVHGTWKLLDNGDGICDQCGKLQKHIWDVDNSQRYCGCCGAIMDGKGE